MRLRIARDADVSREFKNCLRRQTYTFPCILERSPKMRRSIINCGPDPISTGLLPLVASFVTIIMVNLSEKSFTNKLLNSEFPQLENGGLNLIVSFNAK